MKSFFVNEAFDKAVNDYMISKDKPEGVLYNSFLVVIIRMLINIYGELDIINPFLIKDVSAFDTNLSKYGASNELILKLKSTLSQYLLIETKNMHQLTKENNSYFIEVQKCIIDLYNIKRTTYGVTENESREFFDLLYTPGTSNALRLSYNYLNAENIYEIAEYYKTSMEQQVEEEETPKKDLLGFDVYKLFNISIADLSKMDNTEVDSLNKQIYKSLDISENAINKEYLLDEKIRQLTNQQNPITTGNGYVDILLIMSVIITTLMVVVIFVTLVF